MTKLFEKLIDDSINNLKNEDIKQKIIKPIYDYCINNDSVIENNIINPILIKLYNKNKKYINYYIYFNSLIILLLIIIIFLICKKK